jgi:hypothetical protein
MLEKIIAKITSGKWLMTVAFTVTTCYLAWIGQIPTDQFVPMVTMIVGFYFAQSVTKGA